jgi:hypothetical protein
VTAVTKPSIELRWERDWCERHLEPFRPQWPKGAARAALHLFDLACRNDKILTVTAGDPMRLEAAFAEFGPLCCLVGEDEMADVYAAAGVEAPR